MGLKIKRAYEPASAEDGVRVLVDRIWPRGLSKETARIDAWLKDLAPSTELRRWFGHDPGRWSEFRRRYFRELEARPGLVEQLRAMRRGRTLTLVYAARDREHNNARALGEFVDRAGGA